MLSTLVSAVKRIAFGPTIYDTEDEATEEQEEDDVILQMKNVYNLMGDGNPVSTVENLPANDVDIDEEVETTQGVGTITILDYSMGIGVIDQTYRFSAEKFCTESTNFQKGSKVQYSAERRQPSYRWNVTSMTFLSNAVGDNDESNNVRIITAKVNQVSPEEIEVTTKKEEKAPPIFRFPNRPDLSPGFTLIPGDWVKLKIEGNSSPTDIQTIGKILSIYAAERKNFVGRVNRRFGKLFIDDNTYYNTELCKQTFKVSTVVRCKSIRSTQYLTLGHATEKFTWRAVEVNKTKFLYYMGPVLKDNNKLRFDDVELQKIARHQMLLKEKFQVEISPERLIFSSIHVGGWAQQCFKITNMSQQEVTVERYYVNPGYSKNQFTLKPPRKGLIKMAAGMGVEFQVVYRPTVLGSIKEICVFDFGHFTIGREICGRGHTKEEAVLRTGCNKERPAFKKQIGEQDISRVIVDFNRRRIRGSQGVRVPFFSQCKLPLNKVPDVLYKYLKDQDEDGFKLAYPTVLQGLEFSNYEVKLHISLWYEEMENDLRRRQFDVFNVTLTKVSKETENNDDIRYMFHCPALPDISPPVHIQDMIDAFQEDDPHSIKYQGTVLHLTESVVTCKFGPNFDKTYTGDLVTIQFNLGRTNFKRYHYAVDTAVKQLKETFLFPGRDIDIKAPRISVYEDETGACANADGVQRSMEHNITKFPSNNRDTSRSFVVTETGPGKPPNRWDANMRVTSCQGRFISDTSSTPSATRVKLTWFNTKLNEEQRRAVRSILGGQARPFPYIIYGPPGTGKTVTLVEAIMQVYMLDKNSRALVCAPSNAAADVITKYLVSSERFKRNDFVRFNGFLRGEQKLASVITPYCSSGDDLISVAKFRLVVCTCVTAGQFFNLELEVGHFTHVFIDEAGYCMEPEALIPAVMIATDKGGQLILAGDPHQLGPVLMSDVSQNCGLNESLLERLMARTLYMRDYERFPEEKYNPFVLTKLVKNYRAHPLLLTLPSKSFYNHDLIARAAVDTVNFCQLPILKEILVTPGIPLVVDGVNGMEMKEKDSPSWCNIPEALKVGEYVSALMEKCGVAREDIGIITPYRKQVEKIQQVLALKKLEIPKVASVEEFQGGERKIIIISTVRSLKQDYTTSSWEKLSFLFHPKRFNVVVTRAKALMIVIGNPHTLAEDVHWRGLLVYAKQQKAYRGCDLPVYLQDDGRDDEKKTNFGDKELPPQSRQDRLISSQTQFRSADVPQMELSQDAGEVNLEDVGEFF